MFFQQLTKYFDQLYRSVNEKRPSCALAANLQCWKGIQLKREMQTLTNEASSLTAHLYFVENHKPLNFYHALCGHSDIYFVILPHELSLSLPFLQSTWTGVCSYVC